jgi:SAM-dependent methyltransferase
VSNEYHRANRERWEAGARLWAERADSRGLWRRCPTEPSLVLCERELEHLADIQGRRVCVLGSGDNQVVFALAGLGAVVTSVDISENQLAIARTRARELGLSVTFVQADVTDLRVFTDGSFDVVYTGGHVAVWVSDLQTYYREAGRILGPGGLFIADEYHPFRRIWKRSPDALVVESSYFHRGPHAYDASDDILEPAPGRFRAYEFHWTVADYLTAVLKAGCRLIAIEEHGEEVGDWEGAPLQGLPEFLLIVARKKGG